MKNLCYLVMVVLFFASSAIAKESCSAVKINQSISSTQNKNISTLPAKYNNQIKMVFSDIDGTLMPLERGHLDVAMPKSVNHAVRKLYNSNIPFVLITGRSYIEAKEIAKSIKGYDSYIVVLQGAEIYTPKGELIYYDSIDSKMTHKLIKSLEKFTIANKMDTKIFAYHKSIPYSTKQFKFPYNWENLKLVDDFSELGDFAAPKICFYENNPTDLKKIQEFLRENFPELNVVLSTDCYGEITSKTTAKGNAVKKLAKMYNIDLKNVAVVGDSENDLSMLKTVRESGGLAVAVENAMPLLKEQANFITTSVTQDGFDNTIDIILKNNKRIKESVK